MNSQEINDFLTLIFNLWRFLSRLSKPNRLWRNFIQTSDSLQDLQRTQNGFSMSGDHEVEQFFNSIFISDSRFSLTISENTSESHKPTMFRPATWFTTSNRQIFDVCWPGSRMIFKVILVLWQLLDWLSISPEQHSTSYDFCINFWVLIRYKPNSFEPATRFKTFISFRMGSWSLMTSQHLLGFLTLTFNLW
jgi:hypothetical protein